MAAERMAAEGAHVIDIGGQSTRPGATAIGPEEELSRILPVVRALAKNPKLAKTAISIDTFFGKVARECVLNGADIINDVSGGTLDPDPERGNESRVFRTAAELGVPIVVQHMRGTPRTMTSPENVAYGKQYGSVWRGVGSELQGAVQRAESYGIPAWNIILDPGLGFAKTHEGSLELIKHLPDLRSKAMEGPYCKAPVLVGASRKRFLRGATGRPSAAKSDAATVAACSASVAAGAEAVRVHNVAMAVDGVRFADALYKRTLFEEEEEVANFGH